MHLIEHKSQVCAGKSERHWVWKKKKKSFVLAQFICYSNVYWIRKIYKCEWKSVNVKIDKSNSEKIKEICNIFSNKIAKCIVYLHWTVCKFYKLKSDWHFCHTHTHKYTNKREKNNNNEE